MPTARCAIALTADCFTCEVQPKGFECNSGSINAAAIAFEGVPFMAAIRYVLGCIMASA